MFCLSTYMHKYLKSREESLEKIVMHKIKWFGDFYFLTQTQTQTQTPKQFGFEFGFGACLGEGVGEFLDGRY